jgi:hypothetical protein
MERIHEDPFINITIKTICTGARRYRVQRSTCAAARTTDQRPTGGSAAAHRTTSLFCNLYRTSPYRSLAASHTPQHACNIRNKKLTPHTPHSCPQRRGGVNQITKQKRANTSLYHNTITITYSMCTPQHKNERCDKKYCKLLS